MKNLKSLLLLLACSVALCQARTALRRADKISENFKQLDLQPEEIDPNVAPPEPQKVQPADPEDATIPSSTDADGDSALTNNEIVDESANEIPSAETPAGAASPAASAASSEPAATSTAVSTPTKKPASSKPTASSSDDDKNPISRYCKCSESHCDCCRKLGVPLLPSGPGCARISYLGNDEINVSIKYGDLTLASRRISSKRARPICVGLPGGYSKFCGRVYGLSRAKENFKACLAFELRADDEVEAALRVSCFKFGPEGLRVAEAEPLPTEVNKEEEDDDDDIFGFAAGGDDDEEEDDYDEADDAEETEDDDTDDYADDEDNEAEPAEDADYGGFSLGGLLDELDDDDDEKPSKKPATAAAAVAAVAPADQTREHVEMKPAAGGAELPQSKDEAGSSPVVAAGDAASPEEVSSALEAAAAAISAADGDAVTAAPAAASESTTVKRKKSKKTKKNKKKKAASATGEGDFYELLNGILDFFN